MLPLCLLVFLSTGIGDEIYDTHSYQGGILFFLSAEESYSCCTPRKLNSGGTFPKQVTGRLNVRWQGSSENTNGPGTYIAVPCNFDFGGVAH